MIGKKDPRQPQMFYDVADPNLVIEKGDAVAARCYMENDENRDIYIGYVCSFLAQFAIVFIKFSWLVLSI